MKKYFLLTVFSMMVIVCSAYDFTAVSPSGHTLYYSINGSEVTLTSELEYSASSPKTYETPPVGDLVIPESVTYNGNTYHVTSIGNYAFRYCADLTALAIPESVVSIGDCAIADCANLISVNIPSKVKTLSLGLFLRDASLSSIIIPETVDSIGGWAFHGCSSLSSVNIPKGVKSLEYEVFGKCTGLTAVTIPSTMAFIDICVFQGCTSLATVYCYAENIPETGETTFDGVPFTAATLHVPAASVELYKAKAPWNQFGTILPMNSPVGITSVGESTICNPTFYDLSGRETVSRTSANPQLSKDIYILDGKKVIK